MTTCLEPLQPIFDYSFIITTRNNPDELTATIASIRCEAPVTSEIVVVDGSDAPYGREHVSALVASPEISVTYTLDSKTGVFEAMNVGVINSCGRWIIMITAGDALKQGAKKLLESIRHSPLDAIIFSQEVADQTGKILYSFFPTVKSVWPHQSVILKRTVHETLGLYPREYRYASDQHLFALVRKTIRYEMREEVLTIFLLGGITSSASFRMAHEIFGFRRKLGHGIISASVRAYVLPFVRACLERRTGFDGVASRLRKFIFPYYKAGR